MELDGPLIPKKKNSSLKVVALLSYLANGFWALMFLLLFLGCIINAGKVEEVVQMDGVFEGLIYVMAGISIVMVMISILCIYGLSELVKGNKSGTRIYLICNSIWVLFVFYASAGSFVYITLGLVSVIFMLIIMMLSKDNQLEESNIKA